MISSICQALVRWTFWESYDLMTVLSKTGSVSWGSSVMVQPLLLPFLSPSSSIPCPSPPSPTSNSIQPHPLALHLLCANSKAYLRQENGPVCEPPTETELMARACHYYYPEYCNGFDTYKSR